MRSIRKDLGLTQEDLAIQAGISRHAVVRMEQHLYPSALPSILKYLSTVTEYTENELENAYEDEVTTHRIRSGIEWDVHHLPMSYVIETAVSGLHPFAEFRIKVANRAQQANSQIHFCLAFSIHPYTLSHYEQYKSKIPEPLITALSDSGFDAEIVDFIVREPFYNTIIDSD